MSIRNEFNTIGHTICRNEAGNPISSDKGFEKEDTRKKRSFLPLKNLIKNDLAMNNNKYRNKRGVRIAPNISKKFEER